MKQYYFSTFGHEVEADLNVYYDNGFVVGIITIGGNEKTFRYEENDIDPNDEDQLKDAFNMHFENEISDFADWCIENEEEEYQPCRYDC